MQPVDPNISRFDNAPQAAFDDEFAKMMGVPNISTTSPDAAPLYAQQHPLTDRPLTEGEVDEVLASVDMHFTENDQDFLEANGIAPRVQTAEEQHLEAIRREQHFIGQILVSEARRISDEENEDDDELVGVRR